MKLLIFLFLFFMLLKAQLVQVQVTGTKPPARKNAGLVYDKLKDRLILFGGSK
jgi:hypothetical protein